MDNEMGNNNTSAIKEEDNTSEADKRTLLEDSSELANGTSQDVHADNVKEENPNIPTSIAKNVKEKAAKASDDTAIELGKDTLQEDTLADGVKGKIQTIPTAEAKGVQEQATGLASINTTIMLENDSLEGDTHASDVNMENQMHPTAEAEDVQEIATGVTSINTTSMLENDSLEGDTHASDVNMENQIHPTAKAEDVQGIAAELASYHARSALEKDLLEGDTHADDVNVDHQKHPNTEGKDDQEIAARLTFYDQTSEPQEDKPQEDTHANDKQDGNAVIPIANGTDVQGKLTILASDDPLNLINSFGSAVQEITEVRQPEKSPNAGSVEAGGEHYEILSSSMLKGTEEYEKQEESCLRRNLLLTHYHHLDNEPSINQAEEGDSPVLTLDAVDMSNGSVLQESSCIHSDDDELVKVLSERSLRGSESLQTGNFMDTNSHCQQIKDDVLEKGMESQEKMICADKSDDRDGDELGSGLRDTSGTTSDSLSIGDNRNGNLLTKVNYITEDSLNTLSESIVVDNQLKSGHEENYEVLYGERKMSRSGSTMENSHDYNPSQCKEEPLKECKAGMVNTYDMTIGSNGDCNGERNIVLASSVFGIANTDQVEEPKVTENGHQFDASVINSNKASDEISTVSEQKQSLTENGHQFDAFVTNSNKASDEISAVSEQKHSVVPEAEMIPLIEGSAVVDCRHEEGENYNKKIEETYEMPEASYATVETFEVREMSEQCNSHLVTINQKESPTLRASACLLHIYNNHQGSVNPAKSFTATSMPNSNWRQENDGEYFSTTVDKLDSSNLVVSSLDLVDDEAFQKEGEDYSQHIEATSLKRAELTTSAANLSSESCSNNSVFANGGYETRESITRLSTESNPDNPYISSQIQKSPSFNLNLQIEARPEESDQTPLLYQDKSAIQSLSNPTDLNLINSMPLAEYGQCMLQSEEMPVEEKVVTMETSCSEKSKAPFLCLLKEEEEAHLLVMQQKQDNHARTKKAVKEVASTSPKGKEKRKHRSSFFSSCLCCATVAN